MNDIKMLVDDLNSMIMNGKILEAFEKYYADDVTMQENNEPIRVGKDVNRKFEQEFMAGVVEFHGAKILGVAVGDNLSMVEWWMDMTHKVYGRAAKNQVAVQRWQNGQIVSERFYYSK